MPLVQAGRMNEHTVRTTIRTFADELTGHWLDVRGAELDGSQYLKITNVPGVLCDPAVRDDGTVEWEYRLCLASQADPARVIEMALAAVPAGLLKHAQHRPAVPETRLPHRQRFLDPQPAPPHQPDRHRMPDPAGQRQELAMGREHEITMIPRRAVVRQDDPAAAVHRDLPRPDPLIQHARNQRPGDLPPRIAARTQPHRQQIQHIITGLGHARQRPVTEHRLDMRVKDVPVRLLRRIGTGMPADPLHALLGEPGAPELGVDEHPGPLVMGDLELRVPRQPLARPVPGPAGAVQLIGEAQLPPICIGSSNLTVASRAC